MLKVHKVLKCSRCRSQGNQGMVQVVLRCTGQVLHQGAQGKNLCTGWVSGKPIGAQGAQGHQGAIMVTRCCYGAQILEHW